MITYIKDDNGTEWGVSEDGERHRIYAIPQPNMSAFQDKMLKLTKRATKLGIQVPTYSLVREETKVVKVRTDHQDEDGRPILEEQVRLIQHILIFHPTVIVSGWDFVSKLEHTPDGNILHSLPGKAVPLQYRDCPPACDHCKTDRRRNDTFVLHHLADDIYKQVGRQCLSDFLGRDAGMYALAAELYATVDQLASASEDMGEGGWGGERYDMLDTYLSYVAEVISRVGWRSRTTAREFGGPATADIASYTMHPPKDMKRAEMLFSYPSEVSKETAQLAIVWCEELSDEEVEKSDYLHNIRLIARRGVIGYKQYGLAASIVAGYQKHVGELKRKQRILERPSHYVGEVGERRIFQLLVEKVITMTGTYGESSLHLMSDSEGNRFVWNGTGATLEVNKEVTIRGTVKAHQDYNGAQQTRLTRCEEVELKNYTFVVNGEHKVISADTEKEARKLLAAQLKVVKLPKGIALMQQETI